MPAVNVTPSLLLGRPPTRVPVRGAATVDAAVQIIRGGGRALVGNATLAQDVLVALGLDGDSARARVVDTLRLGDDPDEEELSIKAAVVHDGDGDGMIYDGTPWERPAPLQRDAFEVVRMKPIADFAPHVGRPWYGVEDWGDVRVDLPKHFRTADAYKALPEFDDSPETRAAYDALIAEVNDQYRLLTEELGYTVEVVSEDPYPDVKALHADLAENKRIKVLATASTPPGHAYMTDEENDRFRAVHDAFGHAGTGRGFDRHGEEAAYQAHANMFSPLARFALATETRGQNAVLIQSVELTGEGVFPPQKLALLPEEFTKAAALDPTDDFADPDIDNATHLDGIHHRTGGRWQHDASELELAHWVARREAARRGVQEVKAGTRTLYHLTDDPDFELDPTFAPERNTTMGGQMKPGIFLSPTPESWVNSYNYWRPYVVEVEVPEGLGESGGYGSETYVLAEDFDKIKVGRVIPLDGYAREVYGQHGWVEGDSLVDTYTGEKLPSYDEIYRSYPFRDGWRSPDARDMDPKWRAEWENRVQHHLYEKLGEPWTGTEPGILYHGTDDRENVESILAEGIRPGAYLASDTRPVVNRIGSSDGMIFAIAVDDDLHLEPVEDYERVFTAPDGVPAENIVGARWYSYGPPTPPVRIEVGDRTVTAFDGEREVGRLEFDPDGFVAGVGVDEDWQRQGVATAMYAAMPMAPVLPDTGPDSGNTDAGDAWVEAVATGRASRVATKHVARRGEPVESTVLGKGWAGELDPDYRLPSKAITRRKKKNRLPRDADNDGKIYEGTPMERWKALVIDQVKALPRDGDGDGIINEGTPFERPATPVWITKNPSLRELGEGDAISAQTAREIRSTTWYHGGQRPGSEAPVDFFHAGSIAAAMQRSDPAQWDPAIEFPGLVTARLWAVKVAPEAPVASQSWGDFMEVGAGQFKKDEVGVYVNEYEDKGSISLVIPPALLGEVVEVDDPFTEKRRELGREILAWIDDDSESAADQWGAANLPVIKAEILERFPDLDGEVKAWDAADHPTDEKALPRDGDGDGLIYEGTLMERPASPVRAKLPDLSDAFAARTGSYSIPGGAEGDITIHTGPQGSVLQKTFMDQTGPRREVWASGIAERIGVPAPRVVPDPIDRKSVYMDFFTDEEGRPAQTLGEFAGDTYPSLDDPGVARLVQSEAGRRIALLDFVIGNKDRNSGNIVIVDDQPVAIDHAIALESSFGGKDELYGGLFVKNWVQYRVEMGTDKYGDYRITRPEILGHPWSAEELDEAEAAVRDVLPNPDEVGSPGFGAMRRIERLREALPTDETKAAPRDGDNDGMIDDGTPFERPAPLKAPRISHRAAVRNLPVSSGPKLETTFTEGGTYGKNSHITMEERGTIPTAWIANLPGASGEVPGEHRNKQGEEWEAFKADLDENGMEYGVFIIVEHGKPIRLSEGNHRRDAYVELGKPDIPVQIQYRGHVERDGTFAQRMVRRDAINHAFGLQAEQTGLDLRDEDREWTRAELIAASKDMLLTTLDDTFTDYLNSVDPDATDGQLDSDFIYEVMERRVKDLTATLPPYEGSLVDLVEEGTYTGSFRGGVEANFEVHTGPDGTKVLVKKFVGNHASRIPNEVYAGIVAEAMGTPIARVEEIDNRSFAIEMIEGMPGFPAPTMNAVLAGQFGQLHKLKDADREAFYAASDGMWATPEGKALELFDFIVNNTDRHRNNVMVGNDGKLVGIDHSFSWDDPNRIPPAPAEGDARHIRFERETVDIERYDEDGDPLPAWNVTDHDYSREEIAAARAAVEETKPYFDDDVNRFRYDAMLTRLGMLEQALPKASLYDIVEAADKEGPRLPQGAQADVSIKKGPLGSVVIKDFYDEDDENLWHELWAADIARLFDVPSPRVIPYGNTAVAMDLVTTADGTPAPTLMEWVDNEVANRRASEDEPDEPGIVEFFTDRGVNLYDRAADPEAHDEATREYEAILKRPITAVWAEVANTPEGKRIALFDWVTGNADRHDENVLVVDGKPVAIDHSQILVDNGETISSGGFGHIRGMLTDYWIKTEDPKEDWSQGRVLSHPWTREELNEAREHLFEIEQWPDGARPPLDEIRKMRERIDLLEEAL